MEADKYLNSYKTVQKHRQNRRILLYYLILLFVIWVVTSIATIVKPESTTVFDTSLLIILIITWVTFFQWVNLVTPTQINLREAVIFTALKTSNELSQGDTLTASLAIEKLINILSQLLDRNKVSFVDETFTLKRFLSVNPDRINKNSLHKYIQFKNNLSEITTELSKLVTNLVDNKDADYLAVQRFLVFLNNNVDDLALPSKLDFIIRILPILSLFSPFQLIK